MAGDPRRALHYNKGTQAAHEFVESNPTKDWTTYELVQAVIDAVYDDIKED